MSTFKVYAETNGQTFSKKVDAENPEGALALAIAHLRGHRGAKLTVTPEHGAGIYGIVLARGEVSE